MQHLTESDGIVTPTSPDLRLADARRDLAVILLSLGGAFLLTGLVLVCAPLAARIGSSARGPDLLVQAGVAVGGLCLVVFSGTLVVRSRHGWRGSLFFAASLGAVGVGSLIGLFFLAAFLTGGRDHRDLIVPGFMASGVALAGIGIGLLCGLRWARPALAGLAALVSAAFFWGAVETLLSHEVTVSLLAMLGSAPAILVLTSLCLPGGAALISGDGNAVRLPVVPGGPQRFFFVAGSRLSIGLFAFLWLSLTVLAAPNLTNAIHRSRQRQTMGCLRTVMTAVEAYAVDHNSYPEAKRIDALARALEPVYVVHLPRTDAWGWPLDYRSISPSAKEGTGPAGMSSVVTSHCYVVRSPGRDGVFEHADPFACKGGPTNGFDRDIVFASNTPSQWPEGTMGP